MGPAQDNSLTFFQGFFFFYYSTEFISRTEIAKLVFQRKKFRSNSLNRLILVMEYTVSHA